MRKTRIEALLGHATSRAATLLLEGDPGIGKTALWRFGLERASTAGFQILSTQPAEPETKLTYAGLADLLMPVTDAIGSLPEPQRRSLRVALHLQDIDRAPPDPTAVAMAALNVIRALAADAPVLLAVDDRVAGP